MTPTLLRRIGPCAGGRGGQGGWSGARRGYQRGDGGQGDCWPAAVPWPATNSTPRLLLPPPSLLHQLQQRPGITPFSLAGNALCAHPSQGAVGTVRYALRLLCSVPAQLPSLRVLDSPFPPPCEQVGSSAAISNVAAIDPRAAGRQLASKVEQAIWAAAGSKITADYRQRYRFTVLALRTHAALRAGLLQVRARAPAPAREREILRDVVAPAATESAASRVCEPAGYTYTASIQTQRLYIYIYTAYMPKA